MRSKSKRSLKKHKSATDMDIFKMLMELTSGGWLESFGYHFEKGRFIEFPNGKKVEGITDERIKEIYQQFYEPSACYERET